MKRFGKFDKKHQCIISRQNRSFYDNYILLMVRIENDFMVIEVYIPILKNTLPMDHHNDKLRLHEMRFITF